MKRMHRARMLPDEKPLSLASAFVMAACRLLCDRVRQAGPEVGRQGIRQCRGEASFGLRCRCWVSDRLLALDRRLEELPHRKRRHELSKTQGRRAKARRWSIAGPVVSESLEGWRRCGSGETQGRRATVEEVGRLQSRELHAQVVAGTGMHPHKGIEGRPGQCSAAFPKPAEQEKVRGRKLHPPRNPKPRINASQGARTSASKFKGEPQEIGGGKHARTCQSDRRPRRGSTQSTQRWETRGAQQTVATRTSKQSRVRPVCTVAPSLRASLLCYRREPWARQDDLSSASCLC